MTYLVPGHDAIYYTDKGVDDIPGHDATADEGVNDIPGHDAIPI